MLKRDERLSAQIGAAIRAFRAEACPACDGEKSKTDDPFCDPCLGQLPLDMRESFQDRSRFIDLFHPALEHLRKH